MRWRDGWTIEMAGTIAPVNQVYMAQFPVPM
jgi:hypothetical protein